MDTVLWKGFVDASFTVNEAFNSLASSSAILFSTKGIWVPNALTKAVFFFLGIGVGKGLNFGQTSKKGMTPSQQMLFVRLC